MTLNLQSRALPLVATAFFVAFSLQAVPAQAANTEVPTADLAGLSDPPGLKRYIGSVLIYRDDVAYDEIEFPAGKALRADGVTLKNSKALTSSGKRALAMYITPAGRSSLEVIRSYQQDLRAEGFEPVFECVDASCGEGYGAIMPTQERGFTNLYVAKDFIGKVKPESPAGCAGGNFISNFRYALMQRSADKQVVALTAYNSGDVSVYCNKKDFQARSSVFVVRVQPAAREQNMIAVSAKEMSDAMTTTGRVALYGIFFDTGKADIKPESKAALTEIANLMKSQPQLKLHVVGHTDSQGSIESNFDLSKRRAFAIKAALAAQYGVAEPRTATHGVAHLAPVASNGDDAGRAKNRRVELVPF